MKAKWVWMNRCTACHALSPATTPIGCACGAPVGMMRVRVDSEGNPMPVSATATTAPPPSTDPEVKS